MSRVLLAGLFHETHCFVDETTGLDAFDVRRGADLLAMRGNGSMIDGVLEVAAREGWQVIAGASYAATPSGMVEDAVVAAFLDDLSATVAGAGRIDGVFLALHGAMVSQSLADVEGAVLERLRALPGLAEVPVFGVFDLHANMTAAMARHADCLVSYRENPHIDARESAVRAAGLLARALRDGVRPRMHLRHAGIVWPPTGTGTADLPMRALEATARRLEAAHPAFWAVNVVAGFSFADTAETGVAFALATDGPPAEAEAALATLAAEAWALRHEGLPPEIPPHEALARIAAERPPGPAVLVEPSDNIGGGAPGDGTGVLRALLAAGTDSAGVILNDPAAVATLADARPGDRRRLALGGRGSRLDAGPVALEVEFLRRSDGRFTLEDLQSHMVASRGSAIDMGPCAVVRHGGITILLTSNKTAPFDLGQWRSQGIEPADFAVIGVKAAVAHRRAYDRIAAASYTVATPGPCTSDPRALPYRRLARPIFPLDP
jgi:microcystin degradation protein MlrC